MYMFSMSPGPPLTQSCTTGTEDTELFAVLRYAREGVVTVSVSGLASEPFDVATIGLDTDLEALGVDSMIVGNLCAARMPEPSHSPRA